MRMTWVAGSLCVALIAACNGTKRDNVTGAGTESGSMQSGAATDTGMTMHDTTAPSATTGVTGTDTTRAGPSDSAQR